MVCLSVRRATAAVHVRREQKQAAAALQCTGRLVIGSAGELLVMVDSMIEDGPKSYNVDSS